MGKLNVKTKDKVIVIAGVDAGKIGTVKQAFPKEGRVIITGKDKDNAMTMMTRHVKPQRQGEAGGRIEMDRPIHASNVMLICPSCDKPTRLAHKILDNGTKIRVCKHCGEPIDN